MEALMVNWKNYHPSLGILSDEGSIFAGGYSMSQDKRGQTIGYLCKAWDAKFQRSPRVNEPYLNLEGRRLAMHLMFQPEVGMELLRDRATLNQGLLSRVLLAFPEPLDYRPWRDPVQAEEDAIQAYSDHISTILKVPAKVRPYSRNILEPPVIKLSKEAFSLWVSFYDSTESQRGRGKPLHQRVVSTRFVLRQYLLS